MAKASPNKRLPQFYGPEGWREGEGKGLGVEKHWVVRVADSVFRVPPPSPKRRFQQRGWREVSTEGQNKGTELRRQRCRRAWPARPASALDCTPLRGCSILAGYQVWCREGGFPLWSLRGKAFVNCLRLVPKNDSLVFGQERNSSVSFLNSTSQFPDLHPPRGLLQKHSCLPDLYAVLHRWEQHRSKLDERDFTGAKREEAEKVTTENYLFSQHQSH